MEFRGQDEGMGYNSTPTIRASAFSKPTLSPSSSLLLSPRAVPGAIGGSRNGNCFEPLSLPPPRSASSSPVSAPPLNLSPTAFRSSNSPAPHPVSSPPSGATGAAGMSSPPSASSVMYRECLRNHAASIGGHVVDGCGEFMPGGSGDGGGPDAMKCAACGCHRSFHRKEADAADSYLRFGTTNTNHSNSTSHGGRTPLLLPPPLPPNLHHQHKGFPPSSPSGVVPGSSATESSSEELNTRAIVELSPQNMTATPKKRFRTKFTPEQKEKMLSFAESIGWRIQRQDDGAVERFCAEIGLKRQVFKVWMHNNKLTVRKQMQQQQEQQQQPQHPQEPQQPPQHHL